MKLRTLKFITGIRKQNFSKVDKKVQVNLLIFPIIVGVLKVVRVQDAWKIVRGNFVF